MGWTNTQKQLAVRACRAACVSDEHRRDVILRHFSNAKLADRRISSTSPKLSNEDFEQFMAIVESHGGGQVLHFSRGYWRNKAEDRYGRMRRRAYMIARQLEAAGALRPNGEGLAGWISKLSPVARATAWSSSTTTGFSRSSSASRPTRDSAA